MQFPESWLREFCNPPLSSEALAELLTMSGMEVEEARPAAPPFTQVVVAEVLAVERHPNADRLNVCQVDAGTGETLSIVCGAPNVRAGIKVPCALVGAQLPPADAGGKPFEIKLGLLRGVQSQGMLCSARELKLSEDHGGLLILDDAATVGQNIREHLLLDDTLLTLKLTPNLGHCLSVYGIARELSALTGSPLLTPAFPAAPVVHAAVLPVKVEATDLCGRFSGRIVRNVNTRAKTPAWMVDRLARCGQRSVTALVDISNYVMFEYGRPSHIFDLDKIHGGLNVRWGRAGETLKLLNGNTIEVDAQVGVIADDEAVESLAGIMGGDATAVSDDTKNVYVEAAFWWPEAVSGRSRRFNFSTDAGHRFERGVDPASTVAHIERITQLILDICGGEAGPVDDQAPNVPKRQPVTLRVARAAKVIGMPVTQPQCETVMQRLGLAFASAPGSLTVTPPSWRFDLQIEEDLIEEVIRVLGYESLPDTPPRRRPDRARAQRSAARSRRRAAPHGRARLPGDDQLQLRRRTLGARARRQRRPDQAAEPDGQPLAVMRSSLLGSLIGVLRFNLARKAPRVRVFEAGRVYVRDAQRGRRRQPAWPASTSRCAWPAWRSARPTRRSGALKDRAVDFFDVKGDIEAVVRAARRALRGRRTPGACTRAAARASRSTAQSIGHVGELHPQVAPGLRTARRAAALRTRHGGADCSVRCRRSRRSSASNRCGATWP